MKKTLEARLIDGIKSILVAYYPAKDPMLGYTLECLVILHDGGELRDSTTHLSCEYFLNRAKEIISEEN